MAKQGHQQAPTPVDGEDIVTKAYADVNYVDASTLATVSGVVTISGSIAPTVGQALVADSPTTAIWQDIAAGSADALSTTGAAVTVSGASPPTVGQVLTAIDGTTAEWADSAGGGGGGGTATTSGLDTIRIGSNTSHNSATPLLVGQFELDPSDYPSTAVYTLRAVGANGTTPLTTHLRLYNLTDNEQVEVLDFVDTLNPVLVTSQMSTGTVSGTLRTTSTLYEAQVFVDSPVTGADTIELGSAEIRVMYPILSPGVDTIRFDMAKSYASSVPFAVGQFELNVDDYPTTAVFSLRALAANSVATQTSHVTLYNITNSEDVADLTFTDNVNVELQQATLTKGTTSGTLRSSSVIYEARIYIEPTISGTLEFGSAEIRVSY